MDADQDALILVQTTCDQRVPLEEIAGGLVDARLAACVQISGPVQSWYRWQGKLEQAGEWLLSAKSSARLLPELSAFIQARHPYQVPELIALPLIGGSPAYLAWLRENLQ